MTRVLIIGLDGATLDLMKPWMDQGLLPTFNHLRTTGAYGPLRSTIPPYSAPAWVSICTGVNPGTHGIYDFFHTDTLTKKIVNTTYRKAPALWNYLTSLNKTSLIVNVPITYPPEPIQGVLISGLLTPSERSPFTYPASIKHDLTDDKLGTFEFEQVGADEVPKYLAAKYAPDKLIDMTNTSTRSHATVTQNLMKTRNWDLAMVVFRGIDDMQHLLWHKPDAILKCYQQADTCLHDFITLAPDALIAIVSDHGFGSADRFVYPNNVLYNHGLLTTHTDPRTFNSGFAMSFYQKYSAALYFFVPLRKLMRTRLMQFFIPMDETKNIDFDHTTAVYPTICSGGIRITNKDTLTTEEYEHRRDELIRIFTSLLDPDTNKPVITKAYRWEDLYGPGAVNAPLDVIFELDAGYGFHSAMRPLPSTQPPTEKIPRPIGVMAPPAADEWTGDHRHHGVVFLSGPGIKPGTAITGSVLDIVPTVLAVMGLPIPEPVEGHVLASAFVTPPVIQRIPWKSVEPQKKSLLSDQERERIQALRAKKL